VFGVFCFSASANDGETPSKIKQNLTSNDQLDSNLVELVHSISSKFYSDNESVLQGEITPDIRATLSSPDVKFNDKIALIKPLLRQPNRIALVKVAPTLEVKAERYPLEVFKIMELLYVLRCLNACLPETSELCAEILSYLADFNLENLNESDVQEILKSLNKLRGLDSSVSAVVSAASKIFFTVDGMAFDDFAISLTVEEWEIITEKMNKIRLDFGKEIQQKSSLSYHDTTSKKQKLIDKRDLDERIHKARGPLLQILKLNKDDLHPSDQVDLLKGINLRMNSKKIAYERKAKLAMLKTKVLEAYRANKNLDVLKYVRLNKILSL
jgi:hypothetical protein